MLDAIATADLVRRKEASPRELVEAAIARIERYDPELNAVITPRFERALVEAAGELPDGPFRGVPMVLKDLGAHTAGDRFCEGMRFLRDRNWVEHEDTTLAARFKAAGFVVLGKTNTPELGILPTTEPDAFGPTRNPWDTSRSTGGSSGGSAAAVAAGLVSVGHANDGGGSIRIPASACGLVGLKPTRARTPSGPGLGHSASGLTHEHVVTRTMRDTAAVLDAVSGPAPGDPYSAPHRLRPFAEEVGADPGRLRVGFVVDAPTTAVHRDCVTAVEVVARALEGLGHLVEPSGPEAWREPEYATYFTALWASGVAWDLDYWALRTGATIGPDDVETLTWALAELGRSYSSAQYLASLEWLQANTRRAASWWDDFDLLLTPTLAEPPPMLGEFDSPPDNPLAGIFRAGALVPFTPPCNVTGQPAVSLPLHWNDDGLPIGVHFVALPGREDLLLRLSGQLESAMPWAERRPPVSAG